jgi:hypothetical protein
MFEHKRLGFSMVIVGIVLFATPALAEPEWIECTINEISVLSSHLEVSCSSIYFATNPPSLQGRQALSTELAGRARVSGLQTAGKEPTSGPTERRAPSTSRQTKSPTSTTNLQTKRPAVVVSAPIPLPPEKDAIRVYAVAHSNPAAQAILQVLIAAQQPGFTLQIKTDYADIGGVSLGCPERDCRLIEEVRIFQGAR